MLANLASLTEKEHPSYRREDTERIRRAAFSLLLVLTLANAGLTLEQVVTTERVVSVTTEALISQLLDALRAAVSNAPRAQPWAPDTRVAWADEANAMPPPPASKPSSSAGGRGRSSNRHRGFESGSSAGDSSSSATKSSGHKRVGITPLAATTVTRTAIDLARSLRLLRVPHQEGAGEYQRLVCLTFLLCWMLLFATSSRFFFPVLFHSR